MGASIEVSHLSKRFGIQNAVDDVSFVATPGRVTGFLGPNGAGKTTTMRMMLGLVTASSGSATFGGRRYRDLKDPLREVGSALEATSFHPGRSGRNHLRVLAAADAIATNRVDAVLEMTGMTDAANRRVGGYSLGMRQRLALSAALLGDPGVLVLDEPINGLDPEGIRWIRTFLRALAAEGRTVLISSHMLAEVEQTVDEVVIISKGRIVHTGTLAELEAQSTVLVDSADRTGLATALAAAGAQIGSTHAADGISVSGMTSADVGLIAMRAGIALSLLTSQRSGIESAFFDLTEGEGGDR